ncbi:MAG: amino acid permease [bacterium]
MEHTNQPDLERRLGLFPLTNIVIANMIGAGIFTTSGLLMNDLNNPLLMLALWVIGGGIALCGALAYGQLGAAMPSAGGEYTFLSTLYHPLLGFLSGWISLLVGFSAPIAASAIGFSEYFNRAFPELFSWGDVTLLKKILSILVIVFFSIIHMRGIEFGSKIQNVLTLLKVGLITLIILAGLSLGTGTSDHFFQGGDFTLNFGGWKTLGLSLMWIMFAYSGWNASTYIGSEIKDPSRVLPRSLLLGTGIVMLLYVCLNIVFIYAVSPEDMKGVISIGGLAIGKLFGQSMETLVSMLISFALFSSLSAFIILGPRVYFSMARDKLFFKSISRVHPKFGAPTYSIALQGGISLLMVLSGTFDQILTVMGFSLGIFPLFAVAGVFKIRSSGKANHAFPRYSWAPIIYLVTGVSILLLSFFERTIESSIAILGVLAGIPVYYYFILHRKDRM